MQQRQQQQAQQATTRSQASTLPSRVASKAGSVGFPGQLKRDPLQVNSQFTNQQHSQLGLVQAIPVEEHQSTNENVKPCSQSFVNLEAKRILGQGSFGFVFEAIDRDTGQTVAVKRTMKAGEFVSREFQVLDKLQDCENVVRLLNIYYSKTEDEKTVQNMVFEYCSTNLEDVIQQHKTKNSPIPMEEIRNYMHQIFEGMSEVHKRDICHRDLKPENILKTEDGVVKICDFGSAKVLTPGGQNTPYIVSRYYRAPELILACSDYTNKIDIWAIGCIFAEFVTLRPLFPGKTEGSQFLEQVAILGKPSEAEVKNMSKQIQQSQLSLIEMIDDIPRRDFTKILPSKIYKSCDIKTIANLLEKLLEWDPDKRLTCDEALKHAFFK